MAAPGSPEQQPLIDIAALYASKVTPVTKVIVESGANLKAEKDMNIMAVTDMKLSSSVVSPGLSINYVNVDSDTSVEIKSGSKLAAKNLEVDALTNLQLTTGNKVSAVLNQGISNLLGITDKNKMANVGVSYIANTISNKAIIENNVDLTGVTDSLKLNATTLSYHKDSAQNGAIPILDKNRTAIGAIVDVKKTNITNEAKLYSNVNVNNELEVNAYYKGNIISSADAYCGGGNDGLSWALQDYVSGLHL